MPPDRRCKPLASSCTAALIFRRPQSRQATRWAAGPQPKADNKTSLNEQPRPDAEQQDQAPPLRPDNGIYEQVRINAQKFSTLFDGKATNQRLGDGSKGVRPAPKFTERQYAVLTCLCRGDPNKMIGRKLGMTEMTVKAHIREIMRKLGVGNRTQVALAAAHNGVGLEGSVEVLPRISWRRFPRLIN